ncbi:hypothetical protein [Pseudomonas indica]|uniref:hypothetical protein n=1 Tax=Pseudomonas indica TaxID=137658 RepID=UPI000BABEB7B|nr:hypothetical protein [Pseudomonas indica]PAU55311.1 hypothetical protein BZL42_19215 [Pseudomonas indica]
MSQLIRKSRVSHGLPLKPLDAAILFALAMGAAQAETRGPLDCDAQGCASDGQPVVRVISKGESEPLSAGSLPDADGLARERRATVDLQQLPPGKASARLTLELPGGGSIWATEDPALTEPVLNVQGSPQAAFAQGRLTEPVRFHVYSNYAGFIERMELVLYRGSDIDRVTPLATQAIEPGVSRELAWNIDLPEGTHLRQGDELQYVLRAYGADGSVDETWAQRIRLVRPEDRRRSLEQQRLSAGSELRDLSAEALESRRLLSESYGRGSALRQQNIPIHGSRVRVSGQDIPDGYQLSINGQPVPVDLERKFVAEYLLPVGSHTFDLRLRNRDKEIDRQLQVDVTGRYLFLVAIADVTASENRVSGAVEALSADDRYEDFLVDGRLGFYLKGKIRGKYLITAQADTREQRAGDLFSGFFRADAQDVFRRLDPDAYYPVYGDDSTTRRDVDTQGKLYVRVDWDRNQALWGNFQTGLTGTEYAQYVRSLYGAALKWRSRDSTGLGEARSEVRVFGSEAQTSLGHSEFLGTGGSLYYLRHTDILRGSEQVVLELRDPTTGRVEARTVLVRDVDYQLDELQGRMILTRPLLQISRENAPTLTRDTPLGGYTNVLLVDYEYISRGIRYGEVTAGLRGKQWFGEHLALGGTYVDENRAGDDYRLMGVDTTLQAGRGTYLKLEQAHSESTSAPVFYSDNGGLSFARLNPNGRREGDAQALEARANLKELGLLDNEWALAGWYRLVDSGYSISRFDIGMPVVEKGAEFSGELSETLELSGRASRAERGIDRFDQAQIGAGWQLSEDDQLDAELRQTTETRSSDAVEGTLGALRYTRRITPSLEVYGVGQLTLDNDNGRYRDNDALTLGGKYLFGDLSSVGAEVTGGDRGNAASINGEYRVAADHSLYGGYTVTTDSSAETDPLFGGKPGGLTLGQRWRLSNQASLFNESQWLKSGEEQGIAHTFGMDFYPVEGWNYGFTVQEGELEAVSGVVDRHALSVRGGHVSAKTTWSSALEYRRDTGAEERRQWLTTHRMLHKLDESWRIAGRLNISDTRDQIDTRAGARFVESNLGFSWRPADNTRWGLLGKYTYLYDLSTLGQEGDVSRFDQRSHVLALEGTYRFDQRWEFAGKLAERLGQARAGRLEGEWFDSRASLAAAQMRYRLQGAWSALGEYRVLDVKEGGVRQGWLLGVDRDVGENFRVGAGYNFTDFSDDLTRLDYRYQGWFLNFVGFY